MLVILGKPGRKRYALSQANLNQIRGGKVRERWKSPLPLPQAR